MVPSCGRWCFCSLWRLCYLRHLGPLPRSRCMACRERGSPLHSACGSCCPCISGPRCRCPRRRLCRGPGRACGVCVLSGGPLCAAHRQSRWARRRRGSLFHSAFGRYSPASSCRHLCRRPCSTPRRMRGSLLRFACDHCCPGSSHRHPHRLPLRHNARACGFVGSSTSGPASGHACYCRSSLRTALDSTHSAQPASDLT
jgi:hypothetical protein